MKVKPLAPIWLVPIAPGKARLAVFETTLSVCAARE